PGSAAYRSPGRTWAEAWVTPVTARSPAGPGTPSQDARSASGWRRGWSGRSGGGCIGNDTAGKVTGQPFRGNAGRGVPVRGTPRCFSAYVMIWWNVGAAIAPPCSPPRGLSTMTATTSCGLSAGAIPAKVAQYALEL